MYGHACATYESASLRMFRLGRTDTIRSTSVDSLKFVQSMDDPDKSVRISKKWSERTPLQKIRKATHWANSVNWFQLSRTAPDRKVKLKHSLEYVIAHLGFHLAVLSHVISLAFDTCEVI